MARRNTTGALLVVLLALAKADGAIVGVVAPALRADLHLDDARLGLLASLAGVTGAFFALPAGSLIDRRHRPLVITVALAVWSLALGIGGLATGFALLALARLVSGAVATVARPAAVSMIGDTYDPAERGAAMGALDAGQSAGAAACFLVGAVALHFFSWRWAFWWLAAAGLVLAVFASRLPEPVASRCFGGGHPLREADSPSLPAVLRELVRVRTNAVVLVGEAIGNFFYAGVTSFAVIFVTERYGMSAATVDAFAPLIGVVVIAGLLVGGRVGDRLAARAGGASRLTFACVLILVAALVLLPAIAVHSLAVSAVLLSAGAALLAGSGPCLDAVRLDVVRPAIRGRAEAARGLLTLGSSALAPVTFGVLAMSLGHHGHEGAGLRDAFLIMLVPLAASAVVLLAGVRHYRADALAAGTLRDPMGTPPLDTAPPAPTAPKPAD